MNRTIKVDTNLFEGPIDLLVYLVTKREVDIRSISISEITDEFLNYINSMRNLNIPVASDFILMAAILTKLKSEAVFSTEDNQKPKEVLSKIIDMYISSKKAAENIKNLEEESTKSFYNDPSDLIFYLQEKPIIANTAKDLREAFEKLENNKKPRTYIKIKQETLKVSDKIEELRKILDDEPLVSFSRILKKSLSKFEAVTYFMALLELCRMGEASTFNDKGKLFVSKVFKLFPNNLNIALKGTKPVNVRKPLYTHI